MSEKNDNVNDAPKPKPKPSVSTRQITARFKSSVSTSGNKRPNEPELTIRLKSGDAYITESYEKEIKKK